MGRAPELELHRGRHRPVHIRRGEHRALFRTLVGVRDLSRSSRFITRPLASPQVYHALLVTGDLKRSESVLVHEGASAVGQAAIRVALQLGCTAIYTTVAGESQRRALRLLFPQLDGRHVLSCADGTTSFEWHIRTLTKGRGVDVVLSALPGNQLQASFRCLAAWGRMVHYGREDMRATTTLGRPKLRHHPSDCGVGRVALPAGAPLSRYVMSL